MKISVCSTYHPSFLEFCTMISQKESKFFKKNSQGRREEAAKTTRWDRRWQNHIQEKGTVERDWLRDGPSRKQP